MNEAKEIMDACRAQDKDGSGTISKDEFRGILISKFPDIFPEEMVDRMLSDADGKVKYADFAKQIEEQVEDYNSTSIDEETD